MSDRLSNKIPHKKQHLPSKLIGKVEVYYALIVLYIIGYAILRYAVIRDINKPEYKKNYSLLIYLFTYSLFTFYLVLKAASTYSVYEYYIALFILVQKIVILIVVILNKDLLTYQLQSAMLMLICSLKALELTYLVANLVAKKQEINYYLFKLSGVDPSINNAYAIRKMLEVIGEVLTFASFCFFFAFAFVPFPDDVFFDVFMRTGFFGLYVVTYFFTFANNKDEIRSQRIAAMVLTVLCLGYMGLYTTTYAFRVRTFYPSDHVYYQHIVDVCILLTLLFVFSCIDFKLFGSGLKEASVVRANKLCLDSSLNS